MKELSAKVGKLEIVFLILMNVLLFLAIKSILPAIIYLILTMVIGLYFSPIKIMLLQKDKSTNKFHKMGTAFLSSTTIILSYVVLVNPDSMMAKYFLLFLFGLNIILLFFWNKKNKSHSNLYVLVLNVVLLNIAYFT